jgi:hypothetical protein
MTTKTFDLTALGKEEISSLYFRSLAEVENRKCHPAITGWMTPRAPNSAEGSTRELELDFSGWYGGFLSAIKAIEPDAVLPNLIEMTAFVARSPEKASTALAA